MCIEPQQREHCLSNERFALGLGRHMFDRFGRLEEQVHELVALGGQAEDVFGGLRRHLGYVNFDDLVGSA